VRNFAPDFRARRSSPSLPKLREFIVNLVFYHEFNEDSPKFKSTIYAADALWHPSCEQ
jgi:hypothetical protein